MYRDAQPDIDVAFTGSSGFAVEDAEAVRRRLSSEFGTQYEVNTEVRFYDILPGAPLPPDVIVTLGSHFLAGLGTVGLNILSSILYDAFKSAASRAQERSQQPPSKLAIEVSEGKVHIEGEAESLESLESSIGNLLQQAQDRSKRELEDD